MDLFCIRQTTLPHTSKLFEDFTYHFDRVERFYGRNPHDPAAPQAVAAGLNYPDERRAALVQALRRQNGDSASLDLLSRPGTVAVVTGQQVGLFSGPAYTIYKALTAVKIAQRLTAQGTPAVPVFWLATEDHDFAEVDHAWSFAADHQPLLLRAATQASVGQRPVGNVQLDELPLQGLAESLRSFPFGEEVAAAAAQAYQPGVTMGAGFRNLLKRLLDRFDLLYLDPLAEDVRMICAPFLERAANRAPELKARLEQRNRELTEAGYHAQVHVDAKTSLFFRLEGGKRVAWNGSSAPSNPESLSPNALLRPVMQDYLLPTVAYVGGPAELAYLAQSQVLYEELLGRMPVAVHRSGFTLLDARARKLLARHELSWPTVYEGEEGIRDAIAHRLVPPAVRAAFAASGGDVEQALALLERTLSGFDRTLVAALNKSRQKIVHQFRKLELKTARESLRRDERAAEEARFLAGLLYPNKHLQERYYTILPFLAKHGFELIDTVYDNIQLECPDHQVLVV